MILHIPVKDEVTGTAIARALFGLTVPVHLQQGLQQKLRNGTPVEHPVRLGEWRLPVFDSLYPCHVEADEHCLDVFVQPFIDDGSIDAQVLTDMQQAIVDAKGSYIDTLGNLPDFWVMAGLNDDQMIADGWFPDE